MAGKVTDTSGAVVTGAAVHVKNLQSLFAATTSASGDFEFGQLTQGEYQLEVVAKGFSPYEAHINIPVQGRIDVTLSPATLMQQVVVTPAGAITALNETAESITVLTRTNLDSIAAISVDDALRQTPGFTLFRRSDSRTANPTSQGISLRGIGASGASRALVLQDGVPLNDPFGGWVYWNRIPRISIASVEVLRGGVSNLYGSGALGGAVNVTSQRPGKGQFSAESSMGNERTPNGSAFASYALNQWSAALSAEGLQTDGYLPVARDVRGLVDTDVASRYGTGELKLRRSFSTHADISATLSAYQESRKNGTPLQVNNTSLDQFTLAGRLATDMGEFLLTGYGGGETYHQSFSSIAADRNSEVLVRTQAVPSQQVGARLEWQKAAGTTHLLVGGVDTVQDRGLSSEIVDTAGNPFTHVVAGGRQQITGIFLNDSLHLPRRWIVSFGGRVDVWQNSHASTQTFPLSSKAPATSFIPLADRTENAFSPRLSVLRPINDHISLSASGYRSFRAPTLNELYRTFRVGNINTLANDKLTAERLTGVELGSSLTFRKLQLRANVFRMDITRPIANATLSSTPALITRQRQNIGRTASTGLDFESAMRFNASWSINTGYQFADAVVLRSPGNASLQGLTIPQIARHQFTSRLDFSRAGWTLGLQGRASGRQFEDDQNLLPLGRYGTMDLLVSKQIRAGFAVFFSAENLLNEKYAIGRTPVATLGQPFFARVGVRFSTRQ